MYILLNLLGRFVVMAEIVYTIVEKIGVLSDTNKGWTKELNFVSWNGKEAKYDIREWSEDHEKMRKGITISKEEIAKLKLLLDRI
jgi:hypothetical protein